MTLNEINEQIAALKEQAVAIRADELAALRESIATAGFTQDEVFPPAAKRVKTVGVPKFRNPVTGATWTGKGRRPDWINSAVPA